MCLWVCGRVGWFVFSNVFLLWLSLHNHIQRMIPKIRTAPMEPKKLRKKVGDKKVPSASELANTRIVATVKAAFQPR